jgi:hypothetical protein
MASSHKQMFQEKNAARKTPHPSNHICNEHHETPVLCFALCATTLEKTEAAEYGTKTVKLQKSH